MESYLIVGKEGRAVGSGSCDLSIITAVNLIMNGSFFLFLLLLGLHHVRVARKLLIRELPLALLEKVLILRKTQPSGQGFDVNIDLHLSESFFDLPHFLQLVEALFGVTVVADDFGEASSSLGVLAEGRRGLSGLLLGQVQKLAKLSFQGVQTVPSDSLLVERSKARQFVEGKVEFRMLWASPSDSCKAKTKLILKSYFLLNRSWFFTEAIDRFEFHLFQLFLHLFCYFGLALGPFVSHLRLHCIFSLPAQSFMVFPDVSKLHPSFFFCVNTLIEHVRFFVLLFLIYTHCIYVYRIFGFQLVWHLFDGLIFIGLLWLFTESAHIWCSWLLFWGIFSRDCSWLAINWRDFCSFGGWRHAFLALKRLLRLFFLWFFVLWRHWIEHSWRPLIFFILSKRSNINSLPLVLTQSLGRVIKFRMQRPRMPAIGLYNPFNHVKRDVEFLLNLFNLLLFRQSCDISVQLAHLISHISLFRSLLHQSRLLFEPTIQVLQGSHLILS